MYNVYIIIIQEVRVLQNYIIRECEMSDYKEIYKLNTVEMGYDYPEEKTRIKLQALLKSDKDKIYVACVDDAVVGYIHANDYDVIYAPHMKNIMGIAVLSEFKRMGIGRELLIAVENWAKNTGAGGVRLASGSKRNEAHEFYKHCGYNSDKQQIRFIKIF